MDYVKLLGSPEPPSGHEHSRLHAIDSIDDHSPALEKDYGKFVRANPITGEIEFVHKGTLEGDFSTNYQTIEEPPDVSTVPVGDSWTHPFKVEEYRLIEQDGERWWVETTSPKLILARIFDHTFDKSFN